MPWPLPDGSAVITPPDWLAALHAQIQNGDVTLGNVHLSAVDAALVTGANGAITVSGSGTAEGQKLALTLAIAGTGATGTAPLRIDAQGGGVSAHFLGALNRASEVTGQLNVTAPHVTVSAGIGADADTLTATTLQIISGKARLDGTAQLSFSHPQLAATLTGQNLDVSALNAVPPLWPGMPVSVALNATNVRAFGQIFPTLRASIASGGGAISVNRLQASLPGGSTLAGDLRIGGDGAISGAASLTAPALPGLLANYGIPAPAGWSSATLRAALSGSAAQLRLQNLAGEIAGNHVSGDLVIGGHHAGGSLTFDRLDLAPLLAWLGQRPNTTLFSADMQITAARATLGPVPLSNLLVDGALDGGLTIRRASAQLFNGLVSGSLSLDAKGQVTNAQGFVSLPSAAPLAALLPPAWQPPAVLLQPRLNLTVFAEGPPNALATSAVATLGDFTLTAAPTIDLTKGPPPARCRCATPTPSPRRRSSTSITAWLGRVPAPSPCAPTCCSRRRNPACPISTFPSAT